MKSAPYRAQFAAYVLAMMADNIEHVISYWVVFQKFHSPRWPAFAVLSHWLPFLLFSVAVGSLADRFDPAPHHPVRMLLFIVASAGWGFFFITDTLRCGTRCCCWSSTAAPACCGRRRTSCCSTTSWARPICRARCG
jgi:MFS family permease